MKMIPKPGRINKEKGALEQYISWTWMQKYVFQNCKSYPAVCKKENGQCNHYEIPAGFYVEIKKLILKIYAEKQST